jgi:hypothetical protein
MDPDPGGPKTYGSDGSGSATQPVYSKKNSEEYHFNKICRQLKHHCSKAVLKEAEIEPLQDLAQRCVP